MSYYNIALIGHTGVGKTSFAKRLFKGTFNEKYNPTRNCEIYPFISYDTTYGRIVFDIKDFGANILTEQYLSADAAIIFFDLSKPSSIENIDHMVRAFTEVRPNSVITLCGNMCDLEKKISLNDIITIINQNSVRGYAEISVLTRLNLIQPLVHLAQALTGHTDLQFKNIVTPIDQKKIFNINNLDNKQIVSDIKCLHNNVPVDAKIQSLNDTIERLTLLNKDKNEIIVRLTKLVENNVNVLSDLVKIIKENDAKINQIMMKKNEENNSIDTTNNYTKIEMGQNLTNEEEIIQKNSNIAKSNVCCHDDLIKFAKSGYYKHNINLIKNENSQVIEDIWILDREQFMQKYINKINPICFDALANLLSKSRNEIVKELIDNEIFL